MLRIAIIDDEPIVRQELRGLNWAARDCVVVAEGENGAEALDILRLLHPDIMLLDVKMPVMDGLTFLEHAQSILGGTQIIILTMHRDFEYAVEAFRLNAVDFIIKDVINSNELFSGVEKARARLTYASEAREYKREKELEMLCRQNAGAFPFVGCRRDMLLVSIRKAPGMAFALSACERFFHGLSGVERCAPVAPCEWVLDGEWVIDTLKQDLLHERAQPGGIHALAARIPAEPVTQMLGGRLAHARACLNKGFYQPDIVWAGDEAFDAAMSPSMANDYSARLKECFFSVESIGESCLREYLSDCVERHIAPDSMKRLLNGVIQAYDVTVGNKEEIGRELLAAQDAAAALNVFRGYVLRLRLLMMAGRRKEISNLTLFITAHLDSDLSISQLARRMNLSANHLSAVFREQTGVSIKQYIIQARMEKSSLLLRETDLPVNEIGRAVGFPNARYFTNAFSRFFSHTPMEHRKQSRK